MNKKNVAKREVDARRSPIGLRPNSVELSLLFGFPILSVGTMCFAAHTHTLNGGL